MTRRLLRRITVPVFATSLIAGGIAAPAEAKTVDSDPASRGPVVINEIDSNDDDWVEIFNTTGRPIDLTGWVLEDVKNDTDTHALSETIEPYGFVVVDPNVNLDKDGEEVRLKDANGNIVDSFKWTKSDDGPDFHRCADGIGDMVSLDKGSSKNGWNCEQTKFFDAKASSEANPINVKVGDAVDAAAYIDSTDANGRPLITGTTFSWASAPDTSSAGTKDATARVTYPDKSTDEVAVKVTVVAQAVQPHAKNIVINEVVSNKDSVSDWVELYNKGNEPVDISGWTVLDNDDSHKPITFPNGSIVQPGRFFVFYTEPGNTPDGSDGFGLGKGDSVRLFAGGELIDSISWPVGEHATSWGRVKDGGDVWGALSPTKDATNDPTSSSPAPVPTVSDVVINEVESNGDPLDDWIELYNNGSQTVDISGWQLTDSDGLSSKKVTIPSGTVLAPGEFKAFYVDAYTADGGKGFGLGPSDTAALYNDKGELVDSYSWDSHATQTWGRIPDGKGDFADTGKPTKGKANISAEDVRWSDEMWPFDPQVINSLELGDNYKVDDTSGIDFDANGRAWVVNNTTGTLWAVDYDEAMKTYAVSGSWQLRYPGGEGQPDAEGITVGRDGALYVATERDTTSSGTKKISRPSILRFDIPTGSGELIATKEFDLQKVVGLVGPNSGPEAIEYLPEQDLYAVGIEATGEVLFLKLDGSEPVQRYVAPFENVMALDYNPVSKELRVMCDQVCEGASIVLKHNGTEFAPVSKAQAQPEKMPQGVGNEGFATFTKVGDCVAGRRTTITRFLWADDSLVDQATALRAASSENTEDCATPPTTITAGTTTATAPATTVTVPVATVTTTPVTTVADAAQTLTTSAKATTVTVPVATVTTAPVTTVADAAQTLTTSAKATTVTVPVATVTTTPVTTVVDEKLTETVTAEAEVTTIAAATTTVPQGTKRVSAKTTVTNPEWTAAATAEPTTVQVAATTITSKPVETRVNSSLTATVTQDSTTVTVPVTTETLTRTVVSTASTSTVVSTVEDTRIAVPLTTVAKPVTTTVTPTETVEARTVTETLPATTVTAGVPTLGVDAPKVISAKAGGAVNIPIASSDPKNVSVTGLPEGLDYDSEKQAIVGATKAAGIHRVTILQGTGDGQVTTDFELHIEGGVTAPVSSPVTSTTTVAGEAGSSIDGKCVAAIVGWLVPLAVLIPLGAVVQLGVPLPVEIAETVQSLQGQVAQLLPKLDPTVEMAAGGLAATAVGILAIATIANACTGGERSSAASSR